VGRNLAATGEDLMSADIISRLALKTPGIQAWLTTLKRDCWARRRPGSSRFGK